MQGHEDARDAIRNLLAERLPGELAAIRADMRVATPQDPAAYLLIDSLSIAMQRYPVVLVRAADLRRLLDTGDGWAATYRVEVVGAVEVTTARDHEAASRDRDRLSLAIRRVLTVRAAWAPPEVSIAASTLTESHGPAAETLAGRPLAVSLTTVDVTVFEANQTPGADAPTITDGDVQVTAHDATEALCPIA